MFDIVCLFVLFCFSFLFRVPPPPPKHPHPPIHPPKHLTPNSQVQIEGADLPTTLPTRHVILVEDMIDTGTTLRKLVPLLEAHTPASLRVVSLFQKRVSAEKLPSTEPIPCLAVVGFSLPDVFGVVRFLFLFLCVCVCVCVCVGVSVSVCGGVSVSLCLCVVPRCSSLREPLLTWSYQKMNPPSYQPRFHTHT